MCGKALRSLQRALNDPNEQLNCETLVATTIMDRIEVLFDSTRSYNKAIHAAGIGALLIKRGPPNLNDDLDIHLAFENHGSQVSFALGYFSMFNLTNIMKLSHCVIDSGENLYATPLWRESLKRAVGKGTSPPSQFGEAYHFEYYVLCWPSLIEEARLVHNEPSKTSREMRAIDLYERVTRLAAEVKPLGEELMEKARRSRRIIEVIGPGVITGVKYEFTDPASLQ